MLSNPGYQDFTSDNHQQQQFRFANMAGVGVKRPLPANLSHPIPAKQQCFQNMKNNSRQNVSLTIFRFEFLYLVLYI